MPPWPTQRRLRHKVTDLRKPRQLFSQQVISQGLFYLAWLMDHRAGREATRSGRRPEPSFTATTDARTNWL